MPNLFDVTDTPSAGGSPLHETSESPITLHAFSVAGDVPTPAEGDALGELHRLVDGAPDLGHPVEALTKEPLNAALQRGAGDGTRATRTLELDFDNPSLHVEVGQHEVATVRLHGRLHQVEQLIEGGCPPDALGVVDGHRRAIASRRHSFLIACHRRTSCRGQCRKPYHAGVQLVVLAAGHGRRFGGLKQLASVGRDGEALMDFTAADAVAAGFEGVVLIVREEVQDELIAHIGRYWPPGLEVRPVIQGPIAGTTQAVASARDAVTGSFGVVNADDLYGQAAISLLSQEIAQLTDHTHSIVGYQLADTVLTDAPVTRGVCEISPAGELVRIAEQQVVRQDGGFSGKAIDAPAEEAMHALSGAEVVSMNLWGFDWSIFEDLDRALTDFDPATAAHQPGKPPELLLPMVVGDLVAAGLVRVRVAPTEGRCIGITHPDDLPLVRELVEKDRYGPHD
jgi:hypothetical protein